MCLGEYKVCQDLIKSMNLRSMKLLKILFSNEGSQTTENAHYYEKNVFRFF